MGETEVLRDIAMVNQFLDAICYNWLCVNDSNYTTAYGGGLSGQPTKCRYC